MEDKVGSAIPTAAEVSALIGQVAEIKTKLSQYCVTLNEDERQTTTKWRKGGETIVALIGELTVKHGVTLPNISVDGLNADLQVTQALQPLANEVADLNLMLSDTILEAKSECWWATTAFYSSLCRIMGSDSSLAAAMKPAIEFFKRKKK